MIMTRNQQAALRCLSERCSYTTPPECQGAVVTESYACSPDYIYVRTYDASDWTVVIEAYDHPPNPAAEDNWAPWNGAPPLGRRVGVIYRGPACDEPE